MISKKIRTIILLVPALLVVSGSGSASVETIPNGWGFTEESGCFHPEFAPARGVKTITEWQQHADTAAFSSHQWMISQKTYNRNGMMEKYHYYVTYGNDIYKGAYIYFLMKNDSQVGEWGYMNKLPMTWFREEERSFTDATIDLPDGSDECIRKGLGWVSGGSFGYEGSTRKYTLPGTMQSVYLPSSQHDLRNQSDGCKYHYTPQGWLEKITFGNRGIEYLYDSVGRMIQEAGYRYNLWLGGLDFTHVYISEYSNNPGDAYTQKTYLLAIDPHHFKRETNASGDERVPYLGRTKAEKKLIVIREYTGYGMLVSRVEFAKKDSVYKPEFIYNYVYEYYPRTR